MSAYLDNIVDYINLIQSNQDTYYEIRDYLREALAREDSEETIKQYISEKWGATWADFTDDLIFDVHDLQDHEIKHRLPTTP